jgi:glycosyltransferase involved in cell wall biosynthesis
MSFGVRAYLHELLTRLPYAAPDIAVAPVGWGENFGPAEQLGLPLAIARSGARLVHFPTTFAPLLRTRPYVLTIHDLIHLRYAALFGRATALHYRLIGIPLARGAARLVMGDERTVRDCAELLGVDPGRCRVVPLGYHPALLAPTAPPLPVERPFFFYAGNHKPHKNLAALYAAWAAVASQRAVDLRLTGSPDPAGAAPCSRLRGRVVFTGHLDPGELGRHYRAALAYVHPAFTEGFGLPMLEAAVVGTPVIASASAVPSMVAPYAATFEPSDVAGLTALLAEIVRDPKPYAARAAAGAAALRV